MTSNAYVEFLTAPHLPFVIFLCFLMNLSSMDFV